MAYFRFRIVNFFKNHKNDQFTRTIAQNDPKNLKIISRQKNRVWGQIIKSIKGQLRTSLKGSKLYIKMTLLKLAF